MSIVQSKRNKILEKLGEFEKRIEQLPQSKILQLSKEGEGQEPAERFFAGVDSLIPKAKSCVRTMNADQLETFISWLLVLQKGLTNLEDDTTSGYPLRI